MQTNLVSRSQNYFRNVFLGSRPSQKARRKHSRHHAGHAGIPLDSASVASVVEPLEDRTLLAAPELAEVPNATDVGEPDLVGLDFDIAPIATTYAWGQTLETSFRVENIGTGSTDGPFQVGVYLSNDSNFDSNDFLLGVKAFPGLQAGSKSGAGINFALPAAPPPGFVDGPMHIGLWVDDRDNVPNEASESNNQGRGWAIDYRPVGVVSNLPANGDPIIGAFSVDASEVIRGEKITLTASGVADDGPVSEVVFYLDTNGSGALDESDMFIDYGSRSDYIFTANRVPTDDWPIGTHLLFARATDSDGNFSRVVQTEVTVLGSNLATPDEFVPLVPLPNGTVYLQDLSIESPGEFDIYMLSPRQDAEYTVVTTGVVDTQLAVYFENGTLIAEDNDSGGGLNARITQTLSRGNDYFVVVRAEAETTGAYGLQLSGPSESSAEILVSGLGYHSTPKPVEIANSVRYEHFRVTAPVGTNSVNLTAELASTSTELDLTVRISDAFGNEVAFADGGGPGEGESLVGIPVEGGRTYFVTVYGDHQTVGSLELALDFEPDFELSSGTEFPVNSLFGGDQDFPDVGRNASGDSVVVWSFQDLEQVSAQRFDAAGQPVGSEFRVNAGDLNYGGQSSVAVAADGGFVVTWYNNSHIFIRHFDNQGIPITGDIQVDAAGASSTLPSIAMNPNGDYVIAWGSFDYIDPNGGIFAQRFDAVGNRIGSEIHVNTTMEDYQGDPDVTILSDGSFFVAWDGRPESTTNVYGQGFDANGNKIGPELRINVDQNGWHSDVAVASNPDGRKVVLWRHALSSGDWSILGRIIDSSNSFDGDVFQVNTTPIAQDGSTAYLPTDVVFASNETFVAVWVTEDSNGHGIAAREFFSNGSPRSPEFLLSQDTNASQYLPAIAGDGHDSLLTVWTSAGGSSFGEDIVGIQHTIADIREPELEVLDTSGPVSDRLIDFGQVDEGSLAVAHTITIRNEGTAALDVSDLELFGAGASAFVINSPADFSLLPGQTHDVTVTFTPSTHGEFLAAVRFSHNDTVDILGTDIDANPHSVSLVARVSGVNVTLGVDETSIEEGGGIAVFTATLSGVADAPVTVDLGFGGTATFVDDYLRSAVQIVIPAGSLTGTVTVAALQDTIDEPDETVIVEIIGVTNGTELNQQQQSITILDDDEPSQPSIDIIDNGAAGFSTQGNWVPYGGQGRENDVHYSAKGTGADTASWTFDVTPGQYRVSATWSTNSNRATDAPYTVLDGAAPLGTVTVNQKVAPDDLDDAGSVWEDLGGPYLLTGATLTVRLSDLANGYVIADAVRIELVGAAPSGPEVQVSVDGLDIADESGSVNFGSTAIGTPVSKTFTVTNMGNQPLTLQPVSVPAGFTVTTNIPPNTVLAPSAGTTFTVRMNAGVAGTPTGDLWFDNTDSDESRFNFEIHGSVVTATLVEIIDNGATGFGIEGSWVPYGGQGRDNDVHYSAAGSGADVASWTFNVTPGQYRVSATWSTNSNRATNAPYTILDGATPLGTVAVNQQVGPDDFTDSGSGWEDLGVSHTVTGSTLTVRLSDAANGYVIADAVRIERIGDLAAGPEIQVLDADLEIADTTGIVDFGATPLGTPVSKTITVKNVGNEDLALQPVMVQSGFTVTSNIPASTILSPGATTTFIVRLDASSVGGVTANLTFDNTDSDESPYDFTVSGTVTTGEPPLIIDNGDSGFTTVGNWTNYPGQGFGNAVHYSAAGGGASIATWTFDVTPGQYRVSATWSSQSNRATNAPYTLFDGANALGTVPVNQELAPNDLNDSGVAWEDLGFLWNVTGTTLIVQLSDAANEYVIADAVRIERIGDLPSAPTNVANNFASYESTGHRKPIGSDVLASQWAQSQNIEKPRADSYPDSGASRTPLALSLADVIDEIAIPHRDDASIDSLFEQDAILPELLIAAL